MYLRKFGKSYHLNLGDTGILTVLSNCPSIKLNTPIPTKATFQNDMKKKRVKKVKEL